MAKCKVEIIEQLIFRKFQRDVGETSKSTIGLMEELAEALRVRKLHPKFLAEEAADVLSLAQNITNAGIKRIKIDSADVLKKISEGVKALVSSGFDCVDKLKNLFIGNIKKLKIFLSIY